MPAPNRFKQALAERRTVIGCWLGFGDAYVAEVAAGAGFDWLLIDGEHGPNDLRRIMDQVRVVEAGPTAPIVRPPDADPAAIKQLLDLGVRNLLIPMVESGAAAAQILRATRYPPLGFRGVGYGLARASRFGRDKDYAATADAGVSLMLQVESRAGIAALDDILDVDGIDGVFIGPADLAADLGHLGDSGHPEVVAAVSEALGRIAARGLTAGVLTDDPAKVRLYAAAGANFLGVGVDLLLYARAMDGLAASYNDLR